MCGHLNVPEYQGIFKRHWFSFRHDLNLRTGPGCLGSLAITRCQNDGTLQRCNDATPIAFLGSWTSHLSM
jgi:hypothetical protein